MATNNELVTWAQSVLDRWSSKISAMLGVPAIDVTFKVGDTGGNAGVTNGTTVTLSAKWFRDHPDDEGGVVHEIVHAFMQAPEGSTPKTEAIADYVRYKLGLTYEGWTPSARVERLDTMGPERVRTLAQNLSADVSVVGGETGGTTGVDRFAGFYHGQRGQGLTIEQIMDYWDRLGPQLEAQGLTLDSYLLQFGYTQDDVTEAGITTPTDTSLEDILAGITGQQTLDRADYVAQVIALGLKPGEVSQTIEAALAGGWDMNKFTNALRRDPDFQARFELGYEAQLSSLGIAVTPDIQQLLQEAVARGYNSTEFMYRLQQTQSFRDRFPGIFLPNGQLRMSVEQYLGYEQQYRLQAQRYGYAFNSQIMGGLVTKGITPELFQERLQAVQRVQEYKPALEQFEAVLKQKGLLPPGGFDKGDVYKIVRGMANPLWYKVWEEASARTAAVNAGLSIGVDLSGRDIRQLVRRLPGQQTEEGLAAGFTQVAEGIRTVVPLSEARQYGVTREDILKAVFGGKGASRSRSQIERAEETAAAFEEERAAGEFLPGGTGQQGRGGTAQ